MRSSNAPGGQIFGERRTERRYPMELPLHWRLIYRRRLVDSGTGRTRDLSSHGILCAVDKMFAEGSQLEVSVAWPALLQGAAPLKLKATGLVMRSDGKLTAIRVMRHEFRTAAASAQRQAKPSARNPSVKSMRLLQTGSVTRFQ